MNPWISSITTAIAICVAFVSGIAAAATFPEKPIRIIVPTAIGGPSDLCIRAVTESMQANLGQPLVGEMFAAMTGLDMVHVPYRGESAVAPELAAGRIHMMFMADAGRKLNLDPNCGTCRYRWS